MCSLLLSYIQQCALPIIKKIRLFYDKCPGQNKNNTVVKFCQTLVNINEFKIIVHYFSTWGCFVLL